MTEHGRASEDIRGHPAFQASLVHMKTHETWNDEDLALNLLFIEMESTSTRRVVNEMRHILIRQPLVNENLASVQEVRGILLHFCTNCH